MTYQEEKIYNSNLLKGTGLVQEMLVLIEAFDPGESSIAFQKRVLEQGLLSKSTENRIIDVVRNIFTTRFLGYEIDVPVTLANMRNNYVSMDVINQLFYIYTCRANPILGDFVREVYFPFIKKGFQKINTNDPKDFIRTALSDGRIPKSWSTSTINKVSEHMIACMIDFNLIDRSKTIIPFRIIDLTANYLAHELHFRGFSDDDIWKYEDWQLFGLEPIDVINILERLSYQGSFLFQFSGELLNISWKYKSMDEFVEYECR
jgi:hypothetical protein